MLKTIVSEYDPQRLFLPTSASGPREFLDVSPEALGSNHDVHGPWQYQGPERHYDLYNRSDSLLHSEFGVDGFTNEQAADAFLTEQNRKLSSMKENLVWRHHGAWWDTTERDNGLFGACRTLEQQILRSQLVQAEGLRYAVEANRRRAFQNCGSIIWQFNEPWPNLSCTNLVDYYGQPKAAWWWVRRAYAPLAVSLRYNGLVCKPGEPFLAELWLSANACCYTGFVRCRLLDLAGHILFERSFKASLIDRHSARVGCIDWLARPIPHGVFLVELTADGLPDANQYLFSYEKEQPLAPLLSASAAAKVAVTEMVSGIRIENRGDVAALFIKADCRTAAFSDNCFHLLPGQNRDLTYEGDLLAGLKISWLNRSSS